MIERIMELLEQTDASELECMEIQAYIEQLEYDSLFLEALEQEGVDDWEGYSDAYNLFEQWQEEEEED